MIDFLLDNPIVLFFVLIGLARLFRKSRGTEAKAPTTAAEEARRRADKRTARSQPLEKRLEALAQELQTRLELGSAGDPGASAGLRAAVGEPSRPLGTMPLGASLEAASLETASLRSRAFAGGSIESPSLESTASDAGVDYDLNDPAFVFHSAIEEPVGKAYHLDTFSGFHTSTGARSTVASRGGVLEELGGTGRAFFNNIEDVRRAFILAEALGRPRSQRPLARR